MVTQGLQLEHAVHPNDNLSKSSYPPNCYPSVKGARKEPIERFYEGKRNKINSETSILPSTISLS